MARRGRVSLVTDAFQQTIDRQREAADPARSAFVAANAGAGKTRVLTDRAARLLLTGADPAKILCITFTKAAAAEMAGRLFEMLGKWALADDAKLTDALQKLTGDNAAPDPKKLAKARRLFARALETPGGLKIQTIHSFCESVLKRFPLEAGVAPGFTVLEDGEALALVSSAIIRAGADPTLKDALARLAARFGPTGAETLIREGMMGRQSLSQTLEEAGGWAPLISASADALGIDEQANETQAKAKAIEAIDENLLRRAREIFAEGLKTSIKLSEGPLDSFCTAKDMETAFQAVTDFFCTTSGGPRSKLGDAEIKKIDPTLSPALKEAQAAFMEHLDTIKAAAALEDTRAFLQVLEKVCDHYQSLKDARAALDYDDLIIAARRLFQNSDQNAWVMYKLDGGLDHILLDEAQDTSPSQWRIIEGPLKEFFAGEGAHAFKNDASRTFFAVGDQKQSIYSFQGADAGLFAQKQVDLGKTISAATPNFKNIPLTLSFRTTEPVLNFVDALFAEEKAREGLSDDTALLHEAHRLGEAGLVEYWPPVPRPEREEASAWDAPVDARAPDNPGKTLCDHIAATIKDWLAKSECLEAEGRPLTPGDIMILVQSRSALFHQMIASLSYKSVPVAGADKLALLSDPAVEDLMAYARAVLLPGDDLSLAETLKSPFFNINDDELFSLAHHRKARLWDALQTHCEDSSKYAHAIEEINLARKIALREGAYAFFSHVLEYGENSGRKRLYARLSEAVREPVDEFLRQALAYERGNPRSLQGFLSWALENAGEIKRDLDNTGNAVRVMTVHGAKGLESGVVFLLDAHRAPDPKKLGPIFSAPSFRGDPAAKQASINAPILSASKDHDSTALSAARSEAKLRDYEEYRRLLYVAATRARDRLYICSLQSGKSSDPHSKPVEEKTWAALCEDALSRMENVETTPHNAWTGDRKRIACAQTKQPPDRKIAAPAEHKTPIPSWLFQQAAKEGGPRRLAPSRLADDAEAHAQTPRIHEPGAYSPLIGADRFMRGRVLHRLLELLPPVADSERDAAADRLLARLAGNIDEEERNRWRDEVLTVLRDPAFADAFGPASRAEVSIAGAPAGLREGVIISGQIDRLAVFEDRVLVIDYKTNRPPPLQVEDTSPAYLSQMAAYRALLREIYPNRSITSALLWTFEARLMPLPDSLLDHALVG